MRRTKDNVFEEALSMLTKSGHEAICAQEYFMPMLVFIACDDKRGELKLIPMPESSIVLNKSELVIQEFIKGAWSIMKELYEVTELYAVVVIGTVKSLTYIGNVQEVVDVFRSGNKKISDHREDCCSMSFMMKICTQDSERMIVDRYDEEEGRFYRLQVEEIKEFSAYGNLYCI